MKKNLFVVENQKYRKDVSPKRKHTSPSHKIKMNEILILKENILGIKIDKVINSTKG